MKCANKPCKWLGKDGECRLFAGSAATECNYRVAKPAKTTQPKKGKK